MIEVEAQSPPAAPRLRRLRSTFGAIAGGLGVASVPPVLPDRSDMTRALAAVFKVLAIDLVIDIGAGSGAFGTMARAGGYGGHIASFEPVPSLFAGVEALAAADRRWEVSPVAIGAGAGTLPLNIMDLGAAAARRATITRRDVAMRSLDQVLPPLLARHDARRVFLNIDAPLREREILAGAEQSLGWIGAVQTRLGTTLKSDGMPHYLAILSLFEAKHFSPHRFFPLGEDLAGPVDFTCCLVSNAKNGTG
ncbi:FkbM family methyltransferase [Acidiphilium acidophilum]|uniref:FkbM family methyltransferase n=1 Tax=Acidiphilium acidophilum TaxID=76588 RepID=A0AAW9DVS3_ACIAO|nr:FkbM family methyltransferase [Acidiphilium acidophilum]MDX5932403.1 FkbM family methyltransferase [Acidiphilium acidophilum]